jgi:SNF2 family DNA or RNA helicase
MDKVLIVVPKSLLTNWTKEFEKFKSPYKVGIYHGADRKNFDFKKFDVVLTTYSTAYLDLQKLNEFVFSLAIFDEIQIVKNHKSITSDAMKQIKAKQKIGLSGTPMENGISELWNVMDILNPNVFMDHASFMTTVRKQKLRGTQNDSESFYSAKNEKRCSFSTARKERADSLLRHGHRPAKSVHEHKYRRQKTCCGDENL